jgi:hypothetical protein
MQKVLNRGETMDFENNLIMGLLIGCTIFFWLVVGILFTGCGLGVVFGVIFIVVNTYTLVALVFYHYQYIQKSKTD